MASSAPGQNEGKKFPNQLLRLLVVVILVRICIALLLWQGSNPSAFFKPDSYSYTATAQSLLQGSFSVSGIPEFFRTPGYPLLLVPAVASGHLILVALIGNVLLAATVAWLVWHIASILFPDSNAAWWAVVLYCFEPLGLLYSEKILSETAFTVALIAFLWLLLRFFERPTFRRILISGFMLGLATYIRPASVYLGAALFPVLLFSPKLLSPRKRIACAVLFLATFQLTLVPWIIRNAMVVDYRGFSSAGDWNLYFFSAASIQAKLEHKTLGEIQTAWGANNDDGYLSAHPEQRAWSRGRVALYWGTESRKAISQHWLIYLPIHTRGCMIVMLDPAATEILKDARLYPDEGGLLRRVQDQGLLQGMLWLFQHYPVALLPFALVTIQLFAYYTLATLGLRRAPPSAASLFAVTCLYFILVSGTPAAVARYRLPYMPLVCVCAGASIAHWRAKTLQRAAHA